MQYIPNPAERIRLKKLYEQTSSDKLIEMILEDEVQYNKEPYEGYELLLEEVKKRGLEAKINEIKSCALDEEQQRFKDYDLVVVKTFPYRPEAEIAKGLLIEKGVEAILVADDCGGFRSHLTFTGRGVDLFVKKEDLKKSQEILEVVDGSRGQ